MSETDKNLPLPNSPETHENLALEAKELLTSCADMICRSGEAFSREVQAARDRGLSIEDQQAYIRDLWKERKIPRFTASSVVGADKSSMRLNIIKPGMEDQTTFYGFEKFRPNTNGDTPTVDRDFEKYPEQRDPKDEPIIYDDLRNVFQGQFFDRFGFDPSSQDLDHIRKVHDLLSEASLVEQRQE